MTQFLHNFGQPHIIFEVGSGMAPDARGATPDTSQIRGEPGAHGAPLGILVMNYHNSRTKCKNLAFEGPSRIHWYLLSTMPARSRQRAGNT